MKCDNKSIPDRSRPGLPTTASGVAQQGTCGNYATAKHSKNKSRKREGRRVKRQRVIKDEKDNAMVNLKAVLKRWKEYFEKLMNEENNRYPRTEESEVVNEEVNCVSRKEVKNALRRIKKGKAAGPYQLPVEVWKCMGEMGVKFLTRLFNRLLMGERMSEK